MEKNFENMIKGICEIKPPKYLKSAVFKRIEEEKMKMIARKKMMFQIGFVACGVFSIFTLAIFGRQVLSSEFFSIAVIGFSDLKTVLAMWQDFGFSLLETLPTFSIAATLLPIFILLLMIRQYAKLQENVSGYSLKFKH